MAFTTIPTSGARLTASTLSALITELRPVIAHKTADETVNNSTTFQSDDHLAVAFAANTTYRLGSWLAFEGPTAADIKFRFSWTGTLTRLDFGLIGLAAAITTAEGDVKITGQLGATTSPSSQISVGTHTADWGNHLGGGLVVAGATAGTLTLQWAQVTATVGNTILKKGSWICLEPTGA